MNKNAQKKYDREFKIGAVKLVLEQGKSVAAVAEDLGSSRNSLYDWIVKFKEDEKNAFPGSGNLSPQDEEIRKLREENRILRMERDLLKKTMGCFVERPR